MSMDPQTLIVAVALWGFAGVALLLGVCVRGMVRDRRHRHQAQVLQRQWELQRQLWDMERQIREEHMADEEREWHRQYRARQAEITREARRRLGLPEEDGLR